MPTVFAALMFILTVVGGAPASAVEISRDTLLAVQRDDRELGKKEAPVTIIEYASLSCPHCADFHKNILPELKKRYIDTGKVRFILRYFPRNEADVKASMLTRCVDKERFFTFVEVLFQAQDNWAWEKNYQEVLENIAKLGGVSGEAFNKCMGDETLMNQILETRLNAAKYLNLQATPTFFINKEKVDSVHDVNSYMEIVERALAGRK